MLCPDQPLPLDLAVKSGERGGGEPDGCTAVQYSALHCPALQTILHRGRVTQKRAPLRPNGLQFSLSPPPALPPPTTSAVPPPFRRPGLCLANTGQWDEADEALAELLREPVEQFGDLYLSVGSSLAGLGQHEKWVCRGGWKRRGGGQKWRGVE